MVPALFKLFSLVSALGAQKATFISRANHHGETTTLHALGGYKRIQPYFIILATLFDKTYLISGKFETAQDGGIQYQSPGSSSRWM